MDWIALAISVLLLLATAIAAARRLAGDARGRFWIAVGAGALSIGAGMTALSLWRFVTPAGLLVAQFVILILVLWLIPPRHRRTTIPRRQRRPWPRLASTALLAMVLLTGIEHFFLPVSNIDDRNYRAARAAYWLQGHTLILSGLHNDRDIAFPAGGSLPFFWAILFTRNETAGLLVTSIAYPLVALGMITLLREMHLTRRASVIGALVFCFTPILLKQTRGLSPELWLTVYTLGCGFWCIRAARTRRVATMPLAMAGVFAVLAINVRTTAIPLLLMVLTFALLLPRRNRTKVFAATLLVSALAVVISGLGLILLNNQRQFGNPLGSAAFRHIHEAELSGTQLRTHFGRMIVSLIDPPVLPNPSWRTHLENFDIRLMTWLGANHTLPMEDHPWPGHWTPQVKSASETYSIPGMLWLPALLVALLATCARLFRRLRLSAASVLTILSLPFLLVVVFLIRWMGLMPRFWIAPYALGVAVLIGLLARATKKRPWARAVCIMLLLIFAIPAAGVRAGAFWHDVTHPPAKVEIEEPYGLALSHIPAGSHILLVAGQASRDYPLFAPHKGFANWVISWGKSPFDADRMRRLIQQNGITDILIANDKQIEFDWDPPIDTREMVAWLSQQRDLKKTSLARSDGMKLFEVSQK